MKLKRLVQLLIFIIITVSSSYVLLSICDCSCKVCFYLDKKSCDLSDNYLNNCSLGITVWQWLEDEFGKYAVPVANIDGPVSPEITKKVSGYEINYGFWSEDSYREYTWEEMFEWKHGRPPTPQELANLTAQQVKDWFIERHTVERWWTWDDPPRDVRTFEKSKYTLCTELYDNCDYEYGGKIFFPDGTSCELESDFMNLRSGDCPAYIPMRVKPGCSKCGMY